MKRITRKNLINDLANEFPGVPKKKLNEMLDFFLTDIMDSVADGDRVVLNGFGKFENVHLKSRIAQNVYARKPVHVPARQVPRFYAGLSFKQLVESE